MRHLANQIYKFSTTFPDLSLGWDNMLVDKMVNEDDLFPKVGAMLIRLDHMD